MMALLLTIHILVAIGLVCVVLLQRSEGGALGMGGGGSGSFLAGRATANLLTRATAILATVFILTSLGLGKLASDTRSKSSIVIEQPATEPVPAPSSPAAPIAR
jgi:preprotein translocase subunit SecG